MKSRQIQLMVFGSELIITLNKKTMNWYLYWYFSIYSIYKRYSKDNYFYIFANGMVSLLMCFFLYGLSSYLFLLMKLPNYLFSNSKIAFIIVPIVFILNYILFVPKKRQTKFYENYLKKQKQSLDILVVFFSILVIGLFFSVLILGKHFFLI